MVQLLRGVWRDVKNEGSSRCNWFRELLKWWFEKVEFLAK